MYACIHVYNVYIHLCIMYKYGIQNMYNDGEYLWNILLKKSNQMKIIIYFKKSKPNANNNFNLKLWHVFLSRHTMKNLQPLTKKPKMLKTCYKMTWHVNQRHITFRPHNIHVIFLLKKLPSACHYPKQLKNISLKMS